MPLMPPAALICLTASWLPLEASPSMDDNSPVMLAGTPMRTVLPLAAGGAAGAVVAAAGAVVAAAAGAVVAAAPGAVVAAAPGAVVAPAAGAVAAVGFAAGAAVGAGAAGAAHATRNMASATRMVNDRRCIVRSPLSPADSRPEAPLSRAHVPPTTTAALYPRTAQCAGRSSPARTRPP